mmetsp:Transcript_9266/g.17719  ORF Transcript_9266/g.17719 Transcript_9266/m.17719 type:complete len:707 (+) Transcript_9266:1322-3442(+)
MWQLLLLGTALALDDIEVSGDVEQHEFQADVARTMDIFINSLYTNKEIFLRESISNASDALDKVRYLSLTDDSILGENDQLEIRIEYDEVNKAVTVSDTGIGMTKDDLIKHLGTVAKSGTTGFVEALAAGGDINLIGQFGVGFYSNFLVSDKIIVTSKNNDDSQHVWVSQAGHTFKVFEDPRGDTLGRGTRLTLMLKSDSHDFADPAKLKKIVQKYSEFVNYPIYMKVKRDVTREVPWTEEELAGLSPEEAEKPNKITETVWEWELINENKPIWLREEVEDEEYNSFYKSISKDTRDPMTHLHFNTEGEVEFTALLYIPAQAPYDLFQNYYGSSKAPLKLYVRRVLITEEFEDILPRYLSFIRGVVDSNDMPLNVARESLQQKKILKLINKKIVRKVLQELIDMADEDPEEYEKFYEQFGKNVKLGLMDDPTNKGKISRLVRFYSTASLDKLTSLDDYIERMKEIQEDIYFIAGDNRHRLAESPLIQKLVKLGYEVLLLDDPIDEYSINSLPEYEKHKIQNVAQDDWKLPEDDDLVQRKERKLKEMYKTAIEWMKGVIEPGLVHSIVVSTKLTDEPSVITTGDHGYSANMERLNKAQAFGSAARSGDHNRARRTWELNPSHPMVKKLKGYGELIPNDEDARESVKTMLDLAMLNSGFIVANPTDMYRRIQTLVSNDLDVSLTEPVVLPDVIVDVQESEGVDETTEL